MKKSRAAAVLVISVMLLAVIFTVAYASDADYTFNAPDWLTKSSINGCDCWITEDNLAVIEIRTEDNTGHYSLKRLPSKEKQKIESSIKEKLENSADSYSGPFAVNSVELTGSEICNKCGFDALRLEFRASMTYFNVDVEASVRDYVFISMDHIITAEFISYSGNGVTGSYLLTDLDDAFGDGFTINESMPSVLRDAVAAVLLVIVAAAVIAGIVMLIKLPGKKKKSQEEAADDSQAENQESHHIMMLREDLDELTEYKSMLESGEITIEQYTEVYNLIISKYE